MADDSILRLNSDEGHAYLAGELDASELGRADQLTRSLEDGDLVGARAHGRHSPRSLAGHGWWSWSIGSPQVLQIGASGSYSLS